MSEQLTLDTWNLCLGLPNKKDIVVDILSANKVKICCLQETEIQTCFPENVLNCGGYTIELEMNIEKREPISISVPKLTTPEEMTSS